MGFKFQHDAPMACNMHCDIGRDVFGKGETIVFRPFVNICFFSAFQCFGQFGVLAFVNIAEEEFDAIFLRFIRKSDRVLDIVTNLYRLCCLFSKG